MSTSERKAHALKRDLSDIKNSMSEINNLAAMGRTQAVSSSTMNQLTEKYSSNNQFYHFWSLFQKQNFFFLIA